MIVAESKLIATYIRQDSHYEDKLDLYADRLVETYTNRTKGIVDETTILLMGLDPKYSSIYVATKWHNAGIWAVVMGAPVSACGAHFLGSWLDANGYNLLIVLLPVLFWCFMLWAIRRRTMQVGFVCFGRTSDIVIDPYFHREKFSKAVLIIGIKNLGETDEVDRFVSLVVERIKAINAVKQGNFASN